MKQRQVAVIDHDIASFKAISRLGRTEGFMATALSDCNEFQEWVDAHSQNGAAAASLCLVVDADSFASGHACYASGSAVPIIIGVPRSLESVSKLLDVVDGRIVEKPFTLKRITEALDGAFTHYEQTRALRQSRDALASRFALLTEREREVGMLLGSGMGNQDIADALGITVRTVKAHRAKVMEKTGAGSIAEYLLKLQRYMNRGRE